MLAPGDPAPTFVAPSVSNPRYVFDTAAGRYLLLGFMPAGDVAAVDALVADHRALFDDERLAVFGVVRDAPTFSDRCDSLPGVRWLLDRDEAVSRPYDMTEGRTGWVLIDPSLRVLAILPLAQSAELGALLHGLPPVAVHAGVELHAPVLIAPRIFEPDFCRALIGAYDAHGGEVSGFMREIDGQTVEVRDPNHKIRRDLMLPPGALRDGARARIQRRLIPLIAKAFQFQVTRMERDLVACYDAAEQGFFRAHRDNTTKGTAHRRFAVTINLDAEAYDGGDLRFAEFGPRTYRAPTGGAVVFSCSLLHEALPVRRGRRYAFLPFLYDEAAAQLREENARFVGQDGYHYRAHAPAE
jgi:hypothetical protein